MHRIGSRTYVGETDEVVTLTTTESDGGQVTVTVNGQDLGADRQFPLPGNPGAVVEMQITLAGPQGATCVVGIATVDGGSDGDFLICQQHNPMPVNAYTFSVAAAGALTALAKVRELVSAPRTRVPAKKRIGQPRSRKEKAARKGGGQ